VLFHSGDSDVPWCSKQGFAPGALMGTFLPSLTRPALGSDGVPQLSPKTSCAFRCSPHGVEWRGDPLAVSH